MKSPVLHRILLATISLALGLPGRAQTQAPVTSTPRDMTIVFVDSMLGNNSDFNNFDRVSRVFTEVFQQRKWPGKISVERFAANSPAHPTELRIFFQGIRQETFAELVFSAWMTLNDNGSKFDFGVIRFRYSTRAGEQIDDRLDHVVRGAAIIAAERVESALFPPRETPKP